MSTLLRFLFEQGRATAFVTVPEEIEHGSEELMDWLRSVQGGNVMTDDGEAVAGHSITRVVVWE